MIEILDMKNKYAKYSKEQILNVYQRSVWLVSHNEEWSKQIEKAMI